MKCQICNKKPIEIYSFWYVGKIIGVCKSCSRLALIEQKIVGKDNLDKLERENK